MKKTNLNRQNHRRPNFKTLRDMKDYLEKLIDGKVEENELAWKEVLEEIVDFQDEDGSFKLLDSYRIESDCRVDFCHEPTYICTALLMKALLKDERALDGRVMEILPPAMHMSCARGLQGHGYDSTKGLIHAVDYFIRCDVNAFLKKYPEICPEFTEMFRKIERHFDERVRTEDFYGAWGEDYEEAIRAIHEYFYQYVFVYGTLMEGQPNHEYFLAGKQKVADGWTTGYEMYDLGSYPGIKEGPGQVPGEIYSVTDEELKQLDELEGEGVLYRRVPVTVYTDEGQTIQAAVYVYNGSVKGCPRLSGKWGHEEEVWYVSYGSNMLKERLGYYIRGGYCSQNGKTYHPCSDTSMPSEERPFTIPYDMYYSNYDLGSWRRSAVAFLDLSKPGQAYGRAYKIKKSQLEEIHSKEGRGPTGIRNASS